MQVMTRLQLLAILGSLVTGIGIAVCHAQDNYEIQVYGSETVPPRSTMLELHSNFIFQGAKTTEEDVYPTEHELHETVEITQGWTPWLRPGSTSLPPCPAVKAGNGRRPHPPPSARAR